jgi:ribonuclease J
MEPKPVPSSDMSLVQVIPLGGVGEIGKNCTVIRQGDDLVVIDVGLSFPNEEMPGVDIVIPDFSYLIENADHIRGIFLTHAHEDHVGSLPYLLQKINAPVYATEFTHALIRQKLEERIDGKRLDLKTFAPGDVIQAGSMTVEPIRVTHSIPETCAMAIGTMHGVILMTGDFKFDFTPVDNKLSNLTRFGELGKEGVVLLMSDSTNVDRPGWGPSEITVKNGLREVMKQAPGRVLLTTFASNIHRLQQAMDVAAELGRKFTVVGRRMEQNLDICERLGYIKVPKDSRVSLDASRELPPNEILVFTTGSQGEPMSALVQMSREEYGRMQLREGDTLIYSARPIPGNEAAIWRTVNRLFRMGVKVVYDPISPSPVHVSGHAYQEELKMMINLTRPFYIAPVHGEPRHQDAYLKMSRQMGYPEHRLFTLVEGFPLNLDETRAFIGDEPVKCGRVLVDRAGNQGISDEVLRDRSSLAREGVVSITVVLDVDRGEIVGTPTVYAKGMPVAPKVLDVCGDVVRDRLNQLDVNDIKDVDIVRFEVADMARKFLQKRTGLRPLIMPTIVEL